MKPPIDILNYDRQELGDILEGQFAEKSYRADQVFSWLYREREFDFFKMTNLPLSLRQKLADCFVIPRARVIKRELSCDGTRKYLLAFEAGGQVEAVMIKQPKRMTLCLSSQIGCAMGCAFCRTGSMGLSRNLSTSEIIQQVLAVLEDATNFGDTFQNVVFMGMGEPLHNFDAVVRALKVLKDQCGLNLSGRRITISSVGLVPAIERFGKCGVEANLAISLNATDDDVRQRIMPITKAYPIEQLIDCLREFPLKRRKRITIEYVMLAKVNDGDCDLERLPRLLQDLPVKINLIPYNANAGLGFEPPNKEKIMLWHDRLIKSGIETTIRWSKGADIQAACGQLATAHDRQQIVRGIGVKVARPMLDQPLISRVLQGSSYSQYS